MSGSFCHLFPQTELSGAGKLGLQSTLSLQGLGKSVTYAHSALTFEPNLGQDPSSARFISYGQGYVLRLESDKASLALRNQSRSSLPAPVAPTIALDFVAANKNAAMTPEEKTQGEHSYFRSSDPSSWRTNVPSYGRVTYRGVYPGIDLAFYGTAGRLEYDFILQPHSDAGKIQLAATGAEDSHLDKDGNLLLSSQGATVTLLKPVAYQASLNGGERQPVQVQYLIGRDSTSKSNSPIVSFSIGTYDHNRPLVIDPVMIYGLDIPGTPGYSDPPYYYADTRISAMTADGAGNTYVAASVGSSNASTNILKFGPTGKLLLNVSLGSESTSITPYAIAVSAAGNIYLGGTAGTGLPTTPGAFQGTGFSSNYQDAFLTVIKSDGSSLVYSTYLGGVSGATIKGVAVDGLGMAYVTGSTEYSAFPATPGSYEPVSANQNNGNSGFVTKFNPTLSGSASVVYSTFLTGSGGSSGNGIAVDKSGHAYVVSSGGANFPVTTGAYRFEGEVASGAYVTKLNMSGTTLLYSAFLGPGNPAAIALDTAGEAYVAGTVESTDFPVTTGAYQTSYPGGFAVKLNNAGSALVYSTFLGGPSGYQTDTVLPTGLAIVPDCTTLCDAYISGTTSTGDFPLIAPIQSFAGGFAAGSSQSGSNFQQGFLVGLAPNGESAVFSTYLGGASSLSYTYAGVAADNSGNVYFTSNVDGADAPVTAPAVEYPGQGFLAKIGPANAGATIAVPAQLLAGDQYVDSTASQAGSIELRNMGSAAVTLKRPFVVSTKEFTETDNCPATLKAGGICTLTIGFKPSAAGARSATLAISSNAENSPTEVALSGVGVNGPNLQLSATTLTFADQVVGTKSAAQVVKVTNSGNQPQTLNFPLTTTANYTLTSNCTAQLAAGSSCQIGVAFSPAQIGLHDEYLYLPLLSYGVSVELRGTGILSSAGNGSIAISPTTLNFGSLVLSQSGQMQWAALMNTGNSPVTINSISTATNAGHGSAGDFFLANPSNYYGEVCGSAYNYSTQTYQGYTVPFSLAPQSSCSIVMEFEPSISGPESGTLTVTDSAVGSPHSVGLSGIGISSVQPLAISPSAMTFPAELVGDPSAAQTFTITNPGEDYVAIDRTFATGDFGVVDGGSCGGTKLAPLSSCSVSVAFIPTTAGTRTGTLTLTDSLSSKPSVFNLTGTGIQANGALVLGQSSLAFGAQENGSTSASLELMLSNPGNSPVTINNIETTGDFAVTSQYSSYESYCGGVLSPGATCAILVAFSPTKPSGPESGSLMIRSTIGTTTVPLSGTSVESAQAIHITPATINFGGAEVGNSTEPTDTVTVYIDNTGGAAVTFPSLPVITGISPAPGSDFPITGNGCSAYMPVYSGAAIVPMPPGASCSLTLAFSPSAATTEKATFKLVDSAGTQTIALSGVGTAAIPAITLQPPVLSYDQLGVGAASPSPYGPGINLYNNGTKSLTISSVAVTSGSADFSISPYVAYCTGDSVPPGQPCEVAFAFHPTAAGYRTGTATFKDSSGNTYTAALAGWGDTPVNGAVLAPQALIFPSLPIQPAVTNYTGTFVTLNNTGNTPFTVGSVSGTNVSSSGDFPTIGSGGYTGCTGVMVQPGSGCSVGTVFAPLAVGKRTGSLVFPITYADKSKASLTATLSGTGLAITASATLSPQAAVFPATVAGSAQNYQSEETIVITNTGNTQFTIGTISGTDLTSTAGTGGDFVNSYGYCNNTTIAAGSTCNLSLYFAPLTTGLKSGTLSVPVTYSSGKTATLTATLSGQGVAPAPILQVSPSGLAFNVEVVGTSDSTNVQTVTLSSTGNSSVKITSITASPNFGITQNGCYSSISSQSFCLVSVGFTPLAKTAPGVVNGTLTIVDNAPGSPHIVKLSGTAISVAQELSLSQTAVSFGNRNVGTASAPQVVYLTDLDSANQGTSSTSQPSLIQINSIRLGGANASDFTETQTCGGSLGFTMKGRTDCIITVGFSPGAKSYGSRTATVTITPAQGSPLVITLTGGGVGQPASLTSPRSGTTLVGSTVVFKWASTAGATGYSLWLGSGGQGSDNLYKSAVLTGTSISVSGLPVNGETIYARLITSFNGVLTHVDYTYKAQ
jgi:hypothetical protein